MHSSPDIYPPIQGSCPATRTRAENFSSQNHFVFPQTRAKYFLSQIHFEFARPIASISNLKTTLLCISSDKRWVFLISNPLCVSLGRSRAFLTWFCTFDRTRATYFASQTHFVIPQTRPGYFSSWNHFLFPSPPPGSGDRRGGGKKPKHFFSSLLVWHHAG